MPTSASRPLSVFLCHSSGDKPTVRELYHRLSAENWINPWLDEEKILPGMDWNLEIEKAVEAADAILVFLSNNSITKEGYVQHELRMVLEYADYKPEGTLFVIPVRLEPCEPPRRLRGWQYADYFPKSERDRSYERLLASLRTRSKALGIFEEKANPKLTSAEPALNKRKAKRVSPKPSANNKSLAETHTYTKVGDVEFVKVPGSKFLMGSSEGDKSASADEQPQHTVDIPYDYYMARFPVTNKQYAEYMKTLKGITHPVRAWTNKQDHPVVLVSWNDAMTYCQWLMNLRRNELPTGLVLRLPTEAEWEKAARGTMGLIYPWGNLFRKNYCNSKVGGKEDTMPVGSYSPRGDSPYGSADMVGNVWEWTHSRYRDYPYVGNDGREENALDEIGDVKKTSPAVASDNRVLRGGAFDSQNRQARAAYRYAFFQESYMENCGFRVVMAPELLMPILSRLKNIFIK